MILFFEIDSIMYLVPVGLAERPQAGFCFNIYDIIIIMTAPRIMGPEFKKKIPNKTPIQ